MGDLPVPAVKTGEILLKVLRIGLHPDPEAGGIAASGIVGQVVEVGEGVEEIFPRERYVVQSVVGCGECEFCFHSRENLCPKAYHTHGFGGSGAYAELFVVPPPALDQGCLIHLPDGVDSDSGLFIEPLAFCISGLNNIRIANNYHLVIIGAGLTGILSALVGRYHDARRVTILDPDAGRTELVRALNLPVDDVITGGDEAVAKILAECPDGAEAVVCALPDKVAIRRAFALTALGGHISLMVPVKDSSDSLPIEPLALSRRELHIHGASGASRTDYVEARQMIAEGIVPAKELITHRFAIRELQSSVDVFQKPREMPLMVILESPPESVPAPGAAATPPGEDSSPPGEKVATESETSYWLTDEEVAEMAKRVRAPVFDYGPGSEPGPSGEIKLWPDLSESYLREKEKEKEQLLERERQRELRKARQMARKSRPAARAKKKPSRTAPSRSSARGAARASSGTSSVASSKTKPTSSSPRSPRKRSRAPSARSQPVGAAAATGTRTNAPPEKSPSVTAPPVRTPPVKAPSEKASPVKASPARTSPAKKSPAKKSSAKKSSTGTPRARTRKDTPAPTRASAPKSTVSPELVREGETKKPRKRPARKPGPSVPVDSAEKKGELRGDAKEEKKEPRRPATRPRKQAPPTPRVSPTKKTPAAKKRPSSGKDPAKKKSDSGGDPLASWPDFWAEEPGKSTPKN